MNFNASFLFALLTLAVAAVFLVRCALAMGQPSLVQRSQRARGKSKPAPAPKVLRFAGAGCHPMEKKDRTAAVIITVVYALTAFFQLGNLSSPTQVYQFSASDPVVIEVLGDEIYTTGFRHFSGLGTGGYNISISSDGEHWSTLWQRKDDPNNPDNITGYYFAQAEGYDPSYALTQSYAQVYRWDDVTVENPQYVRYISILGRADGSVLELAKLCLLGQDGQVAPFHWAMADGSPIPQGLESVFAVDNTVPDKSTWHNSTYFDEIYHARTAKEHIDNVYPYEITHPPLGKLIIGLGIRLFGMTPFGWRFMGVFFGTLMLPILYIFLKNLFGKTPVAACGTILFAVDFMHLTHTRIATIDTYAVFFILGMYFFMYRYLSLPADTPFSKQVLPLFLSGLMWGFGAASKWTVIYAAVGLALLFFMGFYQRLRDWPRELASERVSWAVKTLLVCVAFFVVIPLVIYTLSYLPYAWASGTDLSLGNSLAGLGRSLPPLMGNLMDKLTGAANAEGYAAAYVPADSLPGIVASNQWYMLTYHQGVHQSHPYSAWWFQWLIDARPILYYMDNSVTGYTTRFAAFANPLLCWTGLGAIIICACHCFRRWQGKAALLGGLGIFSAVVTYQVQHTENGILDPTLSPETLQRNTTLLILALVVFLVLAGLAIRYAPGYDAKAAFILVGYLSQLMPWMLVGRTTFEYHYFPSILFLVLAMAYLFDKLMDHARDWRLVMYGFTGACGLLYLMFYPILIGLTIPAWYQGMVRWLESWPF